MTNVVADPRRESEEITLTFTRREYAELLETLKRAEDISSSARKNELDFRMQRIRLERKLRESEPPAPMVAPDTRFMSLEDIQTLPRKPGG